MTAFSQEGRFLTIETPLGADRFMLVGLRGEEAISSPYLFHLDLLSADLEIKPDDIVGKAVTATVNGPDGLRRHFHGKIRAFGAGGIDAFDQRVYQAELVPALWFLSRTRDCRIFQEKNALDVVKDVLGEFPDVEFETSRVNRTPDLREYCVQYRETDLDFISRLLAEEGCFYYFRHEEGRHVMVIADTASGYDGSAVADPVEVRADRDVVGAVTVWRALTRFITGKWVQRDRSFTTPTDALETNAATVVTLPSVKQFEAFDYPGRYQKAAEGRPLTESRMKVEEAGHVTAGGHGSRMDFVAGATFAFDQESGGGSYALTRVGHSASAPADVAGRGGGADYTNSFECLPADVPATPGVPAKPLIPGLQTATVVGPSGEEIFCDEHGRVKVQFHWDRYGKEDDGSSCYVRVVQPWAGNGWGVMFMPRIGMEVAVQFADGDPDRPVVTGCLYNGINKPPFPLPANKTQSGIRTRSSTKGGTDTFNELRFEDKKGSEEVYFHAEKDFNRVVENDDTLTVENHRTITVSKGNLSTTVEKGDRSVVVKTGNDSHDVKTGNRTVTVGLGNDSLTVKTGNQTTKVSLGKSSTEAMQSIELKVGQNSVKIDQTGITLKGLMIKIEGTATAEMKSPLTTVDGSGMLTLKGGVVMIN